jgi:hypothetical protein
MAGLNSDAGLGPESFSQLTYVRGLGKVHQQEEYGA